MYKKQDLINDLSITRLEYDNGMSTYNEYIFECHDLLQKFEKDVCCDYLNNRTPRNAVDRVNDLAFILEHIQGVFDKLVINTDR